VSIKHSIPNLTNGGMLARNTLWNLLGQLTPMLAAVVAIPVILRGLGIPRFGVLSLAWVVIGYFSLFDLGIGRALTKLVADKIGSKQEQAIPALVWTSLVFMFGLGVIGGLLMAAACPPLVHKLLKIPAALEAETLHSFYLMALSIPFITVTSGLRGVLEGLQYFRTANLIRIPTSIFSLAGPLLVLPFSQSLVWIVAVLVLGRVIGALAYLLACFQALPALPGQISVDRSLIKPVMIFGGWMTVSNVISPILVYIDRFVLGTVISVSMIAYYTAPFDMVVRLTVIPGAVAGVLFPAFALSWAQDPQRAQLLLNRGLKYVFLIIFPLTLVLVTLAPEGLRWWLGISFAENSSSVLRWLSAGVFVNSLAHVPFALVQGAGRPDVTAKLHLLELPPYLLAVWLLTKTMGVEGTAIAWTGRLILDTLLIAFVLERMFWPGSKSIAKVGSLMAAGLLLLCLGALPGILPMKLSFLATAVTGFALVGWFLVLDQDERFFLLKCVKPKIVS
jgi:O-antigen/teichoic acid export membrane protein